MWDGLCPIASRLYCKPRCFLTVALCKPRCFLTVALCKPRCFLTVALCKPRCFPTVALCKPRCFLTVAPGCTWSAHSCPKANLSVVAKHVSAYLQTCIWPEGTWRAHKLLLYGQQKRLFLLIDYNFQLSSSSEACVGPCGRTHNLASPEKHDVTTPMDVTNKHDSGSCRAYMAPCESAYMPDVPWMFVKIHVLLFLWRHDSILQQPRGTCSSIAHVYSIVI